MIVIKIFAFALVGCLCLVILKNAGTSYTLLIQLALVAVIVLCIIPQLKELLNLAEDLNIYESVGKESFLILLKIFGVLLVGSVVSDICRDNNENAIAGVVEFCVKIISVAMAIPLISAVAGIAVSFING